MKIIGQSIIFIIIINCYMYEMQREKQYETRFFSINPIFNILNKIELEAGDCEIRNEYINIKVKQSHKVKNQSDLEYLKNCNTKEYDFIKNYESISINEEDYTFLVYKYIYYLDLDKVKKNIIKNKFESIQAEKILNIKKSDLEEK